MHLLLQLLLLHSFMTPFFSTTWVSRYQKGKNQSGFKWGKRWWGLEMQWHQLDHMQTICTSLQTDNHTSTSSLNFYRPDALSDVQPTESKQWRQYASNTHIKAIAKHKTGTLTWTRASSPSWEHDKVGVVPRKPESVTSSTVSPIDSTSVAFTNDTMMYAS